MQRFQALLEQTILQTRQLFSIEKLYSAFLFGQVNKSKGQKAEKKESLLSKNFFAKHFFSRFLKICKFCEYKRKY